MVASIGCPHQGHANRPKERPEVPRGIEVVGVETVAEALDQIG